MNTTRKHCQEIVFNNKCNNAPVNRPCVCEPVACRPPVAANKTVCCNKINNNKNICCNNINTCNNNCRRRGFGWASLLLLAFFI
ncbi:hypothetical protein [Romboutsia sp.]|uniref:hypothetical protein n=1 Tax=Romboutsia sp. TaxID=1965302 RepID=UPI003F2F0C47